MQVPELRTSTQHLGHGSVQFIETEQRIFIVASDIHSKVLQLYDLTLKLTPEHGQEFVYRGVASPQDKST